MSYFDWFKNETLRQALQCRMDGNYDQGVKLLMKAAVEEKSGYACYFFGDAYREGGWGLKICPEDCKKWSLLAIEHGCNYGYIHLASSEITGVDASDWCDKIFEIGDRVAMFAVDQDSVDYEEIEELSKEGNIIATQTLARFDDTYNAYLAALGDAESQFRHSTYFLKVNGNLAEGFKWASLSAKQMNRSGIDQLFSCYRYGLGCMRDDLKATELYLTYESPLNLISCDRINALIKMEKTRSNWRELYLFGRAISLIRDKPKQPCHIITLSMFDDVNRRTKQAVITFILGMKQIGSRHLNRDIVTTIAKLIWSSRDDPMLWKAGL